MTAIVFDIGNVLVAWDPVVAFLPELGTRAATRAFLDRVGFAAWNVQQDRGRTLAEAVAAVPDPADAAILAQYGPRFHLTIAERVPGTWDILDALAARGHAIHAITNWSAELWPVGLATHPRLGEVFGVTVVSGEVGVIKPDPRIYAILCERAGVAPGDCLFIDDSAANAAGARDFGMQAHHFTGAEGLAADLRARGLL
ncbi:MAG: HAD family hydrolase [Gemmobacter sp.]